jgi:integrase
MPRQPRGKRTTTADGDVEVVSKNSNGDGSVYFEPERTSKEGKVRPGYWRASYRDAKGNRRTVSGPTRVQAEARREVKLAEIAAMPAVGSRFSRDTTVAELTDWWLDSVARHQVKTSTLDSYRKFASYLADDIGAHAVVDVGPELLTQWQSKLLDKYAPYTVLNCRKVCRQAFTEAVKFRLIPANPFDLVKAPRAKRVKAGRALSPADAKALITASQELRLGAAVTLLFCQGWRVSEVLGLAWEDLDLDAGTAQIRRGASYTSSVGMVLGSTKTSGAEGVHHLAPVSVAHLRKRRAEQQLEREAMGSDWQTHKYDGETVSMVFTASHGGLANRQAVTKEIRRAAKVAGLDAEGLASHSGRRTVITALYADGGLDLADVARHVGHSDPSTTAEYVRSLGNRPSDTAAKAADLLDPTI